VVARQRLSFRPRRETFTVTGRETVVRRPLRFVVAFSCILTRPRRLISRRERRERRNFTFAVFPGATSNGVRAALSLRMRRERRTFRPRRAVSARRDAGGRYSSTIEPAQAEEEAAGQVSGTVTLPLRYTRRSSRLFPV